MIELRRYNAADFIEVESHTSSKGNIKKYTNGEQWIKVDGFGYEALAEVLTSRVAIQLGLNAVAYEPCLLNGKPACVSNTFLRPGYSEITVGRLLQQVLCLQSSADLYRKFEQNETSEARIAWIVSSLQGIVDTNKFLTSLAAMLWLDGIVYNTDRHLYNIVLIQSANGACSMSPIFDCGAALLSDLEEFPMSLSVDIAIRKAKAKAKPFSVHFNKQLKAVEQYLSRPDLQVVSLAIDDLVEYYDVRHIRRALKVLEFGLQSTGISLQLGTAHQIEAQPTHRFE